MEPAVLAMHRIKSFAYFISSSLLKNPVTWSLFLLSPENTEARIHRDATLGHTGRHLQRWDSEPRCKGRCQRCLHSPAYSCPGAGSPRAQLSANAGGGGGVTAQQAPRAPHRIRVVHRAAGRAGLGHGHPGRERSSRAKALVGPVAPTPLSGPREPASSSDTNPRLRDGAGPAGPQFHRGKMRQFPQQPTCTPQRPFSLPSTPHPDVPFHSPVPDP